MRAAVQILRPIAGIFRSHRVGFSLIVLALSASLAAADQAKRMFNIEAKPATQSLTDYARQAHTQLGYDVDVVEDVLTNAVLGEYESAEALALLLEDTGLEAEHGERGIFIRRVPKREVGGDIEERTPPVAKTNSLRFALASLASAAEVHAAVGQTQTTSGRPAKDSREGEERGPLEEIIVTGTNIRGIAPDSSPTRTFTREDIQISGAATAQDFIQTLTANFGGGSNEDIGAGLPNDSSSVWNGSAGTLGSSVNLRGLGSGSTLVLLNGHRLAPSSGLGDFVDISLIPASALARIEVLSDGASSIYGADAVAGVVNFVIRDDLDGVEGAFRYGTAPEGDVDEYRVSTTGGNVWDTGNALFSYEYYNRSDLSAADRAFSLNAPLPNDLSPAQKRHSVLASISQELTTDLEIYSDFTYSRRDSVQDITRTNGDVSRLTPASRSLNITAGGSWRISNTWFADISGTYSDLHSKPQQFGDAVSARVIDSNIWIADGKVSGTVLKLSGGELQLAIGAQYRSESLSNFEIDENEIDRAADRNVNALFGEANIPLVAPDNAIPGIKRLDLNISGRFEDFSDFGSTTNPKVGVLWSPINSLRLRSSYSTSFNPPPLGRVGATDLNALAVTSSLVNAIFGFTAPDPSIEDVVYINVAGTSKDLQPEKSRSISAGADYNQEWSRRTLSLSATYFDINFEDRLNVTAVPGGLSPLAAPNIAFDNPELLPAGTVVFNPSMAELSNLLDSLDSFSALPGVDLFDAEILNFASVIRNIDRTVVKGVDFNLDYSIDSKIGTLSAGVDGTFLIDFQQQSASTTPLVEQVDTLFNPADFRVRARAGYARDEILANIFVNHTDDYRIDNDVDAARVDSWTTVDLSLSYDTRETLRNSVLNNTVVRLSALNLFDQDPPSTPSFPVFGIFGYDPTNASALGRFLSFEVIKEF